MNLRVLGDNFLCVVIKEEEPKVGSLYLPPRSQSIQRKCRVEFVGPDVKDVVVGDIFITSNYGGQEIIINDINYFNMDEKEILAILPRE